MLASARAPREDEKRMITRKASRDVKLSKSHLTQREGLRNFEVGEP